jgi:hypothetical protein
MRRHRVDVVNATTLVTPKEIRRCIRALEKQLERDFAPVWGVTADLAYVGRKAKPRKGAWQLVLLDSRDVDCGYHDLTVEGLPLGKVFIREASKCSSGWTSTASHELLELLMNPATTFGVMVEDRDQGMRVYSYEVCDPCQDDRFTYKVRGVPMSDFVYPAWYEPWHPPGKKTRFDHRRKLRRPFQVPRACYATFYDARRKVWLDNAGGQETPRLNVLGVNDRVKDRGGSRRLLSAKPRSAWRVSEANESGKPKPARSGRKSAKSGGRGH